MPANVSITQDTANPYSESDIAIDPGMFLTATATDSANNTSRFSAGIAVTG